MSDKQKPITQEQYLATAGTVCPVCSSWEITAADLEMDGTAAWCQVSCDDCGSKWKDVYKLSGYEDLQQAF